MAYAFMNRGQGNDCDGELQMRLWLDPVEDVSPDPLPELVDRIVQGMKEC